MIIINAIFQFISYILQMDISGRIFVILVVGGGCIVLVIYALAFLLQTLTGDPSWIPDSPFKVFAAAAAVLCAFMLLKLKKK
ncbi:MAG: hypothetical protein HON14_12650 [Rhodospirillaceae bacterium]|nr:hypothetical protein [Rhodospirillaceae bacterium]MBT4588102.1 hypothetical protein [Rhodospirillaceae bacterium]MBT4939976.1 hypothetical protein [Rhodospirillaceae bacterium]MBT5941368.1 hypothetical protein [Rhodospirillaceae bacterium]MBT7268434.1 hypothetical protein [Rhodospirillaceae bacterium]